MSAAEHLAEAIDVGCSRDDHDHVGAHRAEVMQEAARIALSLRQFEPASGVRGAAQVSENVGILRVADALAAEGKGTGTTGGEPTPPADFYQPGQTYHGNFDWAFRCDTITVNPESGKRTALGWRFFDGRWHPYAYGEDDWDVRQVEIQLDADATGGGR
ncbi:hypothetical protein [Streptomyces virginiae]|uniref:hypothetical protein n=1 Tax=Streptomyces virginiae TaxID=1961 RepID=UPI0036B2A553